jgi:hypothetical protein
VAKGLGIGTLIMAVIAIIVEAPIEPQASRWLEPSAYCCEVDPSYGVYLGVVSALLGIWVAVLKEQAMAVAIGVINISNAVFQLTRTSIWTVWMTVWVGGATVSIVVAWAVGRSKRSGASPGQS